MLISLLTGSLYSLIFLSLDTPENGNPLDSSGIQWSVTAVCMLKSLEVMLSGGLLPRDFTMLLLTD
jgi:hypothetical protein